MQRLPARWRTRFGSFVCGYSVASLARDLAAVGSPVTRGAVYAWVAGRNQPRLPIAEKIVELSGGLLSLEDVGRHRSEIRDP